MCINCEIDFKENTHCPHCFACNFNENVCSNQYCEEENI